MTLPVSWQTNSPGWATNLSQADYNALVASLTPTYNAGASNALYQAQVLVAVDLSDFLAKMDKIETWIDKTSGTNSLSNNQRDNAINDICQTFKKLRKVLVQAYSQ